MALQLPSKGRSIGVYRGASPTLVAGARTKGLSINGSPIDVTNDDDAAVRKLLNEPGQIDVSITVAGILKNETLIQESLDAADRVQATEFRWPGSVTNGDLTGDFFLASFGITGEYQGAATFEATFESAGAVAFTAAA
jgi:TP901-1 family phage major tail protein